MESSHTEGNGEIENNEIEEMKSFKKMKLQQDVELKNEEGNEAAAVFDNLLNPLMMEDILSGILALLNIKSLKSVRQVCKLWEEEATKEMLKRRTYFVVPEKINKITDSRVERYEKREIKSFISKRRNKIEKISIKTEKDVEILESLGILKTNVKELKFKFSDAPKYLKLMKSLPNLEKVTANGTSFMSGNAYILNTFLSLKKPVVISNLFFSLGQPPNFLPGSLDCFERFCKGQVSVQKIDICTFWPSATFQPKTVEVLNKIFWNNRESLQEIWFWGLIGVVSSAKLEIPQMPNVKTIFITLSKTSDEAYRQGFLFPPQFKFDKYFPNLLVVLLVFSPCNDTTPAHLDFMRNLFENSGPASKVKLVFCRKGREMNTEFLQKGFPNAEIILKED